MIEVGFRRSRTANRVRGLRLLEAVRGRRSVRGVRRRGGGNDLRVVCTVHVRVAFEVQLGDRLRYELHLWAASCFIFPTIYMEILGYVQNLIYFF